MHEYVVIYLKDPELRDVTLDVRFMCPRSEASIRGPGCTILPPYSTLQGIYALDLGRDLVEGEDYGVFHTVDLDTVGQQVRERLELDLGPLRIDEREYEASMKEWRENPHRLRARRGSRETPFVVVSMDQVLRAPRHEVADLLIRELCMDLEAAEAAADQLPHLYRDAISVHGEADTGWARLTNDEYGFVMQVHIGPDPN